MRRIGVLRADAFYWEPLEGQVHEDGTPVLSSEPIPIKVGHESTQKEYRDPMGNIVVSNSILFSNTKLKIGGIVRFGCELESTNASENSNIFRINGEGFGYSVRGDKCNLEYYL